MQCLFSRCALRTEVEQERQNIVPQKVTNGLSDLFISYVELVFCAGHRRPYLAREWVVCWCYGCRFGRVDADLNPSQVSEFYAVDYYTHSDKIGENARRKFLERFALAWLGKSTSAVTLIRASCRRRPKV